MNAAELIQEISVKNVNVDKFVQLAIREDHTRDEIIRQLMTNPHIMVYYHCYYVIAQASQERPELFYPYWDQRDVERSKKFRTTSYTREWNRSCSFSVSWGRNIFRVSKLCL